MRLCAAALLCLLCACAGPKTAARKPDHAKAVDVQKLVVRMAPGATQADFEQFQAGVDKAYAASIASYSGAEEAGFVYSLSPAGAVNPFSAIEVSCITRETHADGAARQCAKFLEKLKQ